MKKILTTMFIATTILFSSTQSYAQGRDAGGTGSGETHEPCPISYKRNNGNGWGVCHGDAQIRVAFTELPSVAPTLTAILYTETNSGVQTRVENVYLPVEGDIIDKQKPYISYCLTGSIEAPGNSQGNIPPAVKLVLEFTYPNGQVCRTDVAAQ